MILGPPGRLALCVAAALTIVPQGAPAQAGGCWRLAECNPSAGDTAQNFRFGKGSSPTADFRTRSGEPLGFGSRRLDGEAFTDAQRRLLQPDAMRFRQYAAPGTGSLETTAGSSNGTGK
jgi:hypothetical protein